MAYSPETSTTLQFTLRDRLGSATTIADQNGMVVSRRFFDPFGKTGAVTQETPTKIVSFSNKFGDLQSTNRNRRGFTDHEHLDEQGLIHMNGRVYDQNLGRFMSVDPFIQSPKSTQSVNGYSYVMNNPMAGTDPTGYTVNPAECSVKRDCSLDQSGGDFTFGTRGKGGHQPPPMEVRFSTPDDRKTVKVPLTVGAGLSGEEIAKFQTTKPGDASKAGGDLTQVGAQNKSSSLNSAPGTSSKSVLDDGSIIDQRYSNLEHGDMSQVNGIVLHHTGASTGESTLNAYSKQATGAHYLVDENGNIYQTADTGKVTWHVGKIRSKCEAAGSCSSNELATIRSIGFNPSALHAHEAAKSYPDRYPTNSDSIGIEIVGAATNGSYGDLNKAQSLSVSNLVYALQQKYNLSNSDVYRHGVISYKNPTEGEGFGF